MSRQDERCRSWKCFAQSSHRGVEEGRNTDILPPASSIASLFHNKQSRKKKKKKICVEEFGVESKQVPKLVGWEPSLSCMVGGALDLSLQDKAAQKSP